MTNTEDPRVPRFAELPISPELPPRSSWRLWGDRDQVGAINLLTPQRVAEASRLVKLGRVFPLNWTLDMPEPPILGRLPMAHRMIRLDGGFDETFDAFNPQASTQWDALCHVEHPEYGFYNGFLLEEITGERGSPLGIDKWATRGIVGRYTLLDIARSRESDGRPVKFGTKDKLTVKDLESALERQATELVPGCILLLHTGWIDWYESLSKDERRDLTQEEQFPSPGLSSGYDMAEWLWDHQVAAVVSDSPSVEAMPFDKSSDQTFLHFQLVALLGMALGEMHDTRMLAKHSAEDRVYEGLFTAAPVNKEGGAGSTGNALAIK